MKLDYDAHSAWLASIRQDRLRPQTTAKALADARAVLAARKQHRRTKALTAALVLLSALYALSAIGAIP